MSPPLQPSDNPYQSPANALPAGTDAANDRVPDYIVRLMMATRPWVRLMGVSLFIGTALMVFATMFIMATGMSPGQQVLFTVLYLVIAILFYLIPGVYLLRYASRITDLVNSGRMGQLADALEAQKTFWRYLGILVLVVLAIYAAALVVGVLFVAMAAR
jgi:hypothetical protein